MSQSNVQGNLTELQTSAQLATRFSSGDLVGKNWAIVRPSAARTNSIPVLSFIILEDKVMPSGEGTVANRMFDLHLFPSPSAAQ